MGDGSDSGEGSDGDDEGGGGSPGWRCACSEIVYVVTMSVSVQNVCCVMN